MSSFRTPKAHIERPGKWASLLAGLVLLLTLLALLPGVFSAEATSTAEMREDLAEKKAQLDEAYAKWDALQDELNKVAEAYNAAEVRAAELENEIAEVMKKIAATEQELQSARIQLEDRLVSIYKDGGVTANYLDVFFSEEDLVSVFDRFDALNQIAEDDQELFNKVEVCLEESKANKALLEEKNAQHAAEMVELDRLRVEADVKLKEAGGEYQAIKAQVTQLEEEIRKADARAAELARQQRLAAQRARAAAAAAAAAQAAKNSGSSSGSSSSSGGSYIGSGSFTFPVRGSYSYTDTWGAPRSGGRTHAGTDIMAARGTPLVACVDGTITQMNRYDTGLGGITLYLKGTNGVIYYYAHCNSLADGLYVGKWVSAGTYVGGVGTSGNASTPHLHFGMKVNGQYVNPYWTLKAAG